MVLGQNCATTREELDGGMHFEYQEKRGTPWEITYVR